MLKPLKDNVLIEVHKSSFTAMEEVDEKEALVEKATVVDVGPEVTSLKKGDIIYFKDYETDIINIDGQKYWLIPEDSVKGIYAPA